MPAETIYDTLDETQDSWTPQSNYIFSWFYHLMERRSGSSLSGSKIKLGRTVSSGTFCLWITNVEVRTGDCDDPMGKLFKCIGLFC